MTDGDESNKKLPWYLPDKNVLGMVFVIALFIGVGWLLDWLHRDVGVDYEVMIGAFIALVIIGLIVEYWSVFWKVTLTFFVLGLIVALFSWNPIVASILLGACIIAIAILARK